jgi:hypothetical protein
MVGTYSRVFGVLRQYVKGLGIAIVGLIGTMYRAEKTKETRLKKRLRIFYL